MSYHSGRAADCDTSHCLVVAEVKERLTGGKQRSHQWSEIYNSLILFGIRKNCLISGMSQLLYQFTRKVIQAVVIFVRYHCYQFYTKVYPNPQY
jgi:hypothetical protein